MERIRSRIPAARLLDRALLFAGCPAVRQNRVSDESAEIKRHARGTTRPAAADAGDDAFLGGDAGRRIAAAALQLLRQNLFPAAAVLPGLRLARNQRVPRQR